jgi:hypothetical protein
MGFGETDELKPEKDENSLFESESSKKNQG